MPQCIWLICFVDYNTFQIMFWLHQWCIYSFREFLNRTKSLQNSSNHIAASYPCTEIESILLNLCNNVCFLIQYGFLWLIFRFCCLLWCIWKLSHCLAGISNKVLCQAEAGLKTPSGSLAEQAACSPDYPCQWNRKWESGFAMYPTA